MYLLQLVTILASVFQTHHGDAKNLNSDFISISVRHNIHIFHILLMVFCLYIDFISYGCCWEFISYLQ